MDLAHPLQELIHLLLDHLSVSLALTVNYDHGGKHHVRIFHYLALGEHIVNFNEVVKVTLRICFKRHP